MITEVGYGAIRAGTTSLAHQAGNQAAHARRHRKPQVVDHFGFKALTTNEEECERFEVSGYGYRGREVSSPLPLELELPRLSGRRRACG